MRYFFSMLLILLYDYENEEAALPGGSLFLGLLFLLR